MNVANFWKNKKVMITGGLGFIGSNLAHRLVELRANVLIVDAMVPKFGGNFFNLQEIRDKVRVNFCDTRDRYSMNCLVREQEVIFNLAGSFNHMYSTDDPWTDLELNCRGSLSLLEACRHNNPRVKVVFAGSRGQYGKVDSLPVNENQVCKPLQINSVNTVAAEQYHILYNNIHGLRTSCLRLTNTYGPRHQMRHYQQGIINWFVRLIMENRVIHIFGDGTQTRDVNYIDDVVNALLLAGEKEEADGRIYNLGGEAISLLDMVKLMVEITGKGGYKLMEYPDQFRIFEIGDYVADYSKIKKDLGWAPEMELKYGLTRTFDYYDRYKGYYWT